ncbi:MAG: hypothetical protein WBM35_17385 [Candidatus Electrothrix sp.]
MYSESVLLYILQNTAGTLPCSSTGLSTDKIKAKDGTTHPATTDNEEKAFSASRIGIPSTCSIHQFFI